jgi:hypothetical protein
MRSSAPALLDSMQSRSRLRSRPGIYLPRCGHSPKAPSIDVHVICYVLYAGARARGQRERRGPWQVARKCIYRTCPTCARPQASPLALCRMSAFAASFRRRRPLVLRHAPCFLLAGWAVPALPASVVRLVHRQNRASGIAAPCVEGHDQDQAHGACITRGMHECTHRSSSSFVAAVESRRMLLPDRYWRPFFAPLS